MAVKQLLLFEKLILTAGAFYASANFPIEIITTSL